MILVPAAGLALGGLALGQKQSMLAALESAMRGALATFGGWALAREIAPDDNPGAFVSIGLPRATQLLLTSPGVLPLFSAIMLARVLNRSVGIPATLVDSMAVTLLVGWTVYSNRNPGPGFVAAAGFGLDALLAQPLRRQWVFAMVCLGGALASFQLRESPVSSNETLGPLEVSIITVALGFALLILLTRHVRSVADLTGVPLNLNRVRAAMAVAWLLGIQGILSADIASPPVVLIWAALGGLLLSNVVRPAIAGMFPLLALGMTGCGPAPVAPLASPPADTLIDVGGHRLHFKIWRNPGSLTLVFEAGGGSPLSSWESVPHDVAAQLHLPVIAYDRAGIGTSETGPFDLTPEQEIRDLGEALELLGVERIILAGHSYGGLLSLFHAVRRTDRVAGLVLVDPMNPDFIRRVTLEWLNTTAPDIANPTSARDTVIVRMKRTIGELTAGAEPGMTSLEIPIVVVTAGIPWWGDAGKDQAWRASHETIAGAKPNRRLLIAAQSRHGIPDTEPERIVEAVRLLLALLPRN
jgi:pimeloyl-ACP methyl ester carboxylesterase